MNKIIILNSFSNIISGLALLEKFVIGSLIVPVKYCKHLDCFIFELH